MQVTVQVWQDVRAGRRKALGKGCARAHSHTHTQCTLPLRMVVPVRTCLGDTPIFFSSDSTMGKMTSSNSLRAFSIVHTGGVHCTAALNSNTVRKGLIQMKHMRQAARRTRGRRRPHPPAPEAGP